MREGMDWNLPDVYSLRSHPNGSATLYRDECSLWLFPPGHSRREIESWVNAYDLGRSDGQAFGQTIGRQTLAQELRGLIHID